MRYFIALVSGEEAGGGGGVNAIVGNLNALYCLM
jgi:hypothetical protein